MFSNLSNRTKIILQLIFVLALCAVVVAYLVSLSSSIPRSGSRSVHLQVDASGGFAIITLHAGKVSIDKPTTVTVPWSKTLEVPSGTEVYLTASNPTQTGKLNCSITLNKVAWKSGTTSAPKDGVACAGIVP